MGQEGNSISRSACQSGLKESVRILEKINKQKTTIKKLKGNSFRKQEKTEIWKEVELVQ